jgi:tetratricopeptide (TPR) repeat protein
MMLRLNKIVPQLMWRKLIFTIILIFNMAFSSFDQVFAVDNSKHLYREALSQYLRNTFILANKLFEEGLSVGTDSTMNAKALYYNGKSLYEMKNFIDAYKNFVKSYETDPSTDEGVKAHVEALTLRDSTSAQLRLCNNTSQPILHTASSFAGADLDGWLNIKSGECQVSNTERFHARDKLTFYLFAISDDGRASHANSAVRACIWIDNYDYLPNTKVVENITSCPSSKTNLFNLTEFTVIRDENKNGDIQKFTFTWK